MEKFTSQEVGMMDSSKKLEEIEEQTQNLLKREPSLTNQTGLVKEISEKFKKVFTEELITNPPIPKKKEEGFRTYTILSLGLGDFATSRKIRNIMFNIPKLMKVGPEIILSVASGFTGNPFIFILTGLVVWRNCLSDMLNIQLSKNHASVIWTMWNYRNPEDNTIEEDVIYPHMKQEMQKRQLPVFDETLLQSILVDLQKLKCIEPFIQESGKSIWLIKESVKLKL